MQISLYSKISLLVLGFIMVMPGVGHGCVITEVEGASLLRWVIDEPSELVGGLLTRGAKRISELDRRFRQECSSTFLGFPEDKSVRHVQISLASTNPPYLGSNNSRRDITAELNSLNAPPYIVSIIRKHDLGNKYRFADVNALVSVLRQLGNDCDELIGVAKHFDLLPNSYSGLKKRLETFRGLGQGRNEILAWSATNLKGLGWPKTCSIDTDAALYVSKEFYFAETGVVYLAKHYGFFERLFKERCKQYASGVGNEESILQRFVGLGNELSELLTISRDLGLLRQYHVAEWSRKTRELNVTDIAEALSIFKTAGERRTELVELTKSVIHEKMDSLPIFKILQCIHGMGSKAEEVVSLSKPLIGEN